MQSKFSKLIQGCMTWGSWGENFNLEEMAHRLAQNVDIGISTFDHADIYGDYTTEASFGKAFHKTGIRRDAIQLISKCGIQLPNKDRRTNVKHYNYSKSYIINQVEQSLKNLKTDYLDLFLLHRPSPLMQIDEIKETISHLFQTGKIIDFGVSNFSVPEIELLKRDIDISVNQIQCSLLHYKPFEDGILTYHQTHDIKTMAWSPFGHFFKIEKESNIYAKVFEMAEAYNCSISQLLLAWLLRHPTNILPVLGTTKINRLREAIGAFDVDMDIQDWFFLYELVREKEVD